MAVGVDIRDDVSEAVKGLSVRLAPRRIAAALGAPIQLLFQEHFMSLGPNKNSWPSTGFWQKAARACNYSILADGVQVNVNHLGVLQRLKGGETKRVTTSWLTIPARQEVYGKRAREIPNLVFRLFRWDLAALVEEDFQEVKFGRKRKDGSQKVKPGEVHGGGGLFLAEEERHAESQPQCAAQRAKGARGLQDHRPGHRGPHQPAWR